jgi:hypothetical protein
MKYHVAKLALFILGTLSSVAYAGEYDFKPGLWETTSKMQVTGVPKEMAAMMSPPPMTEQDCMTEKDILFNSDKECKYNKTKVSAKKLLFDVICKTPSGDEKGKGEINFNDTRVNGWFEMTATGPMGPMTMKSTFTAKYIGACN